MTHKHKNKFLANHFRPTFGYFGKSLDGIHPQIQNFKFTQLVTNESQMAEESTETKKIIDKKNKEYMKNMNFVNFMINKNCNHNNNNDVSFISDLNNDVNEVSLLVDEISSYYNKIEVLQSEIGIPRNVDGVFNLSDYNLSESEISLLNKGLKFCPTPPLPDIGMLVRDTEKFFRTASIKLHFHNLANKPTNSQSDTVAQTLSDEPDLRSPIQAFSHPDLKPKSKWNAPVPPLLEHVKQLFLTELQGSQLKPTRRKNLTAEEFHSLLQLPKNNDIVVKQADKGSGIVIQNRDDYIKEGIRQLTDTKFYKQVDHDLTTKHADMIKKVVSEMHENDEISDKTLRYLTTNCTRTAQFYMLPKIHKSLTDPPGRPIISGNDCPTEKISHMIDIILQPFVPNIRSYVKDTTDFIQKLSKISLDPDQDIILCTLDVTSLYTNIPHKEGIQAVKNLLTRERPTSFKPSNSNIIKLLEMVLTMNNFQFNYQNYLQINGTAMGTRVAPTYANIFMSEFETKHVYTYPKQPAIWVRYIDDVFMIWLLGIAELEKFHEHLNSAEDSIKFTLEWSRLKVPFLDTTVCYKPEIGLYTDLYTKPTDTHSYLRYSSCHPPHIKSGLPYSQFLRLRRICFDIKDFYLHALQMARDFCHRGYPQLAVMKSLLRVLKLDRHTLLQEQSLESDKDNSNDSISLYFITEYNPSNPPFKEMLDKFWPILGRSASTRPLVNAEIIFGSRRPKNLKDSLMNAKLPPGPDIILKENPSCKSGNKCKHCPNIDRSGFVYSNTTKRKFKCIFNGCCQSKNLIYCITCPHCGSQYVGQTKTSLMTRINNHRSTIRTGKDLPLPNHMKAHDDIIEPRLRVHILQFIKSDPDSPEAKESRDIAERDWMARLNTLVPNGMNLQE